MVSFNINVKYNASNKVWVHFLVLHSEAPLHSLSLVFGGPEGKSWEPRIIYFSQVLVEGVRYILILHRRTQTLTYFKTYLTVCH